MNRRNTLILKKAQYVQTVTNVEGFRQANSNSKRNARSLNYSLSHHFSQHIPLFKSHSPSMLRERFLCCDNSRTRELLWHCKNSERGEFCEFELTQHASLISWHKMSIAMWQLNATRLSSQSSKKRDTTSLDQFAQRLQERGYRRCARNLQKTCLHFLPTHRQRCSKQCFLGSHTSISLSLGEESPSNRRAVSSAIMWRPIKAHAFTVSAGMQGPSSTNSEDHRFFLKEEEELAMRPILPRNISMRGSCV